MTVDSRTMERSELEGKVLPELQSRPSALDSIYLHSPTTGQQVPLNTLVMRTPPTPDGFERLPSRLTRTAGASRGRQRNI